MNNEPSEEQKKNIDFYNKKNSSATEVSAISGN